MNIATFNKEVEFSDIKPTIRLILETSISKEIRILLKKGQFMKEHKAPLPIVVHLLTGEIVFGVPGKSKLLKAGSILSLDANVMHQLTAREDSVVRLTWLKMDDKERVEISAKN